MKKSTVFVGLILITSSIIAQNRGGRGGSQAQIYVQSNNYNTSLSNVNYGYSNLSFNNDNNVQQQVVISNNRNVNDNPVRNIQDNVSNSENVNPFGNRGGNEVEVNIEVQSRGNENISNVRNGWALVEQTMTQEPVQIQMDNVNDNFALNVTPEINVPQINMSEINIPSVDLNVDLSLNLNKNLEIADSPKVVQTKIKEEKVKEEKEETESIKVHMPEISFGNSKSKRSIAKKVKVKAPKGYGYKQHVSMLQRLAAKTSKIQKLFKKKTKKVTCSVVCYQF